MRKVDPDLLPGPGGVKGDRHGPFLVQSSLQGCLPAVGGSLALAHNGFGLRGLLNVQKTKQ